MKSGIIVIAFVLVGVFASCTSTDISSFRDPGFTSSIRKIMVVFNSENLNKKTDIETMFCEQLSRSSNVTAVRELDILPPLSEYTHDERMQVLSRERVDAILVVHPQGESKEVTYYTSSSTTAVAVAGAGGAAAGVKSTSSTTPSIRKYSDNNIELFALSTNRVVWKASTSTVGRGLIGASLVNDSYCSTVVDDLLQKKLIQKK
jgi:hypothetical protein